MRLAPAGALLATLVVAAAAGATRTPVVPGAAFVSENTESFGLVSNANWLVDGKPARAVEVLRPANKKSGNPEEHEPLTTIWAPTCFQGRQVVRFKRDIFVAGPLWKLGLQVSGGQPHAAFFERIDVLINGALALRTGGGGGGFERTADKGSLVKWGDNVFEIIAVKKPFDHGYSCRKGGSGRTGISFVVRGDFGTDLALPIPAREDYVKGGSRAYKLTYTVAIRNNGPGGLAGGYLRMTLDAPEGELAGVSKLTFPQPQLPIVGCIERREGREYHRLIDCRLANFRRGETTRPEFSFLGNTPDGHSDVRVTVSSFVDGGYQIGNTRDNSKLDVVVFCGSESANPKCPK